MWILPIWKGGSLSWYLTQVSCPVITVGFNFFGPVAAHLSLILSLSLFQSFSLSIPRSSEHIVLLGSNMRPCTISAVFAAMISVVAAGDFSITCGNLEYRSSTVKATCDDPYGNFIDMSINIASCLAIVNGKLEVSTVASDLS